MSLDFQQLLNVSNINQNNPCYVSIVSQMR